MASIRILLICALCATCGTPPPPQIAIPPAQTTDRPERASLASLPPAPTSVDQLLAAPYLTDDQRADKRIFFGRYTAADLTTPARAARAALLRGAIDDAALDATAADPLDKAEAAALRGDFTEALATLDAFDSALGTQHSALSPRSHRLRADILEAQGRFDDAVRAGEPVLLAMSKRTLTSAEDITEAVRIATQRLRLRGPTSVRTGSAATDYKALMAVLDDVINRVDRLYWPAMLAQAELLASKDNREESVEACTRALELNPACARTWTMLGTRMVEGFVFKQAESIAKRLDMLAGDWSGEDPDELSKAFEDADPGVTSPSAAAIMARLYLRQSEGAQALLVLEPMLARFPHSPRLLALKCAAQATAFDFAAADASLAEFDKSFGRSPLAQYETGLALSMARQYAQSRIHLDEAARRQPNAAEPLIELGLMLLQAGKDADALPALERAYSLDPFNVRADNSLRLARELATYVRVETPHFTIRHKPGLNTDNTVGDAVLARDMAAPLEANYAAVTGAPERVPGGIDFEPREKTVIDLMPDHKWFGVRIAGMPAIHTIAASTGPVIAMESPRDGPSHLGAYDWVRVLRHEFVHTVTLARTDNRIPHWYTEAAAVYLELSPRDYSTCQLLARVHRANELFDFTTINLGFIRPKKPSDRSQAYAQGEWMYEYIIARAGPRAPLELMDKYAAGVREEEAFQSVLGISRAQFLADFVVWSKGQLIEWGMDLPEGTPSIRQLLASEGIDMVNKSVSSDKSSDNGEDKAEQIVRRLAKAIGGIPKDATPEETQRWVKEALQRIADGKATDDDDEIELPTPTPAMIEKWLAAWPRHPDVLELAMDDAVAKAGNKATPEIAPLIDRYAAARPVDPKPHRLLAKMYLDAAESDPANTTAQAALAIPHLEYLDAREQKSPTYAMELAKRYAATGEMDKAAAKSERATQIDPFNARPRELAATIAIQSRDYARAERHIEALTQIEPTREIHRKRLEALEKMMSQQKR